MGGLRSRRVFPEAMRRRRRRSRPNEVVTTEVLRSRSAVVCTTGSPLTTNGSGATFDRATSWAYDGDATNDLYPDDEMAVDGWQQQQQLHNEESKQPDEESRQDEESHHKPGNKLTRGIARAVMRGSPFRKKQPPQEDVLNTTIESSDDSAFFSRYSVEVYGGVVEQQEEECKEAQHERLNEMERAIQGHDVFDGIPEVESQHEVSTKEDEGVACPEDGEDEETEDDEEEDEHFSLWGELHDVFFDCTYLFRCLMEEQTNEGNARDRVVARRRTRCGLV